MASRCQSGEPILKPLPLSSIQRSHSGLRHSLPCAKNQSFTKGIEAEPSQCRNAMIRTCLGKSIGAITLCLNLPRTFRPLPLRPKPEHEVRPNNLLPRPRNADGLDPVLSRRAQAGHIDEGEGYSRQAQPIE